MSFYRIYRPQVIADIDNVSVRDTLSNLLKKKRQDLPHAYLFSGPKGTGKTTAARLIAKIFNCEKPTKTGPCGVCSQCTSIAAGTNTDVLEIDAASNRGIDEIRLLRERIGLSPSQGSFTVYIIDEVHMLTAEAFNALLKTIEEPPAHAVFVLATTNPEKVPATIQSRCMRVVFNKATEAELTGALKRITKQEKMDVDDTALVLVARYADGSFRDAVKMLEQLSFEDGTITEDMVSKRLSIGDAGRVTSFLAQLAQHRAREAIEEVEAAVRMGADIRTFTTDVLRELKSALMMLVAGDGAKTEHGLSLSDVRQLIRLITEAYAVAKYSPVPQLPLEVAVTDFCQGGTVPVPEISPAPAASPPQSARSDMKPRAVAADAGKAPVRKAPGETGMPSSAPSDTAGLITLSKIADCWPDVINELKSYNHSIAGVLRSSRPKSVGDGIVTIEAFYKFHQEKLSEPKVKDILSATFKKLFGANVSVTIVLGKK